MEGGFKARTRAFARGCRRAFGASRSYATSATEAAVTAFMETFLFVTGVLIWEFPSGFGRLNPWIRTPLKWTLFLAEVIGLLALLFFLLHLAGCGPNPEAERAKPRWEQSSFKVNETRARQEIYALLATNVIPRLEAIERKLDAAGR